MQVVVAFYVLILTNFSLIFDLNCGVVDSVLSAQRSTHLKHEFRRPFGTSDMGRH